MFLIGSLSALGVLLVFGLSTGVRRYVLWQHAKQTYPVRVSRGPGSYQRLEERLLGKPPGPAHVDLQAPVSTDGPNAVRGGKSTAPAKAVSVAAAMDGIYPAAEYAWTWASIDEHLFSAVGHMTHTSVSSLADLHAATNDWATSMWTGPQAALVSEVKGHLGEWITQHHLTDLGHDVSMASLSNQPGWDFSLDGQHLVNVKTMGDASDAAIGDLHAHAVIPLLAGDALHLPSDAVHFDAAHGVDLSDLSHLHNPVLVDDSLFSTSSEHATQGGLDVAAGHVHWHIPWITVAIASWREGSILMKGHTDLARAAKNVGATTAFVGGGGAIGAKIGAALGTLIVPGLGTFLGALVGGAAGALTGKSMSEGVRLQPLREAEDTYKQHVTKFMKEQHAAGQAAESEWQESINHTDQELRYRADDVVARANRSIDLARAELARVRGMRPADARMLLHTTSENLRAESVAAKSVRDQNSFWRKWIWPTQATMEQTRHYSVLRETSQRWEKRRAELEEAVGKGWARPSEIFDAMLMTGSGVAMVEQHVMLVGRARAIAVTKAEDTRIAATREMVVHRDTAVRSLGSERDRITAMVRQRLEPHLPVVREAQGKLRDEMRRAGLNTEDPGAS